MDWSTVLERARAARGDGAFLATTGPDGRPHLAWVGIGLGRETLWMATFQGSRKLRNLAAEPRFALHWQEHAEHLVFARGRARLVTDSAETRELWARRVLPYDPALFWSGPEDPALRFVELVPDHVSATGTDHLARPEVWRRTAATAVMPNVFTTDVAATTRFYGEVLGLRPAFRHPAEGDPVHVVLEAGPTRLAVTGGGPADVGLAPAAEHPAEIIVHCPDVDAATAAAAAAGAEVLVPPYDHIGGHRRAYLADPAGNWVALVDA
jgi:predicted enzyme related to lactoylglutathione lyase